MMMVMEEEEDDYDYDVCDEEEDYDEDDDRTAGDNINRWPDQGDEQNDGDVYMCNYIYMTIAYHCISFLFIIYYIIYYNSINIRWIESSEDHDCLRLQDFQAMPVIHLGRWGSTPLSFPLALRLTQPIFGLSGAPGTKWIILMDVSWM